MLSGDRDDGEPEAVKFGGALIGLFRAIHFVDDAEHGQAEPADVIGQELVRGQHARLAVYDEGQAHGVLHAAIHLGQNFLLEAADARGAVLHNGAFVQRHAPCIHDPVFRLVLSAHHALKSVAGNAGHIVCDGAVAADQPVEKRGLAHVGAPHEDNGGKFILHGIDLKVEVAGVPLCGTRGLWRKGKALP